MCVRHEIDDEMVKQMLTPRRASLEYCNQEGPLQGTSVESFGVGNTQM